jgi:hypothetical protein
MDFQQIDSNDRGDETQRNFRYQNAFGAILLIAVGRGAKPYHSIWCEYHEDLLAECQDGTIDAYQIKTRKPEEGLWDLRNEPLLNSLRGFTNLYKVFGERIRNYYFVSNASFPKPQQFKDSKNSKFANNPAALLESIRLITTYQDLEDIFTTTFRNLVSFCQCSEDDLFFVLKRVDYIQGPSRQDFDAVIAHDHLSKLPQCSLLKPHTLNQIRDELVMKIYYASSLFLDDPDRHITPLYSKLQVRPEVAAKRVPAQLLIEVIETNKQKAKFESSKDDNRDNLVFVCHSSPGDDEFAKWLSFQLINAGYSVWCDLLHLKPGTDYEKTTKDLIENKTGKFLYLISKDSNNDQRSLDQLQIAYDKMKSSGLGDFVIPLELDVNHADIFFVKKITPLSFSESWAKGLALLLDSLSSAGDLLKKTDGPSESNQIWRSLFDPEQGVFVSTDEYISNWFQIKEFPYTIKFHKLRKIGGIGSIQVPPILPFPALSHNIYLVSFADASDFNGSLGAIEITETTEIPTIDFLEGNYDHRLVMPNHARKFLVQLINKGWEGFISKSGLLSHQMANGKNCYYYHKAIGDAMVSFDGVNHKRSRRSLWGYKTVLGLGGIKTKKYWHYGISAKAISSPNFALVIKAHVLFSDDAIHIWDSKTRLQSARRSWCNNWWNPHWRDRLLAIVTYLSKDQPTFEVSVGGSSPIVVHSQPMMFTSPMSYMGPKDQMPIDDEEESEVPDLDLLEDYPFEKDSEGYDE